jgi:hypothetical protein
MLRAKPLLTLVLTVAVFGCGSNSSESNTTAPPDATTPVTGGAGGTAPATTTTPAAAGTGGATTPATTAAGGTSGSGTTAAGTGTFTPLCAGLTTAAGAAPTKGGTCTASDSQLCYKTCGPESKGFKSETCTSGIYAEQSGCSFPAGEYSCYKIPAAVDATCPTTAIQASQACTVAKCVVCGGNTGYLDSSGSSKTGYCVCQHDADGSPTKWSCASSTAWPCPAGTGC